MTASDPLILAFSPAPTHSPFAVPQRDGNWYSFSPWADGSVDYILCDDIAEWPLELVHLRLAHIRRLLRPSGVLRIVTEDLDQVMYRYLLGCSAGDDAASPTCQFNSWLQGVGGRFIYNETELTRVLSRAGFIDIQHFVSGASGHKVFWSTIKADSRALVLEARRPVAEG